MFIAQCQQTCLGSLHVLDFVTVEALWELGYGRQVGQSDVSRGYIGLYLHPSECLEEGEHHSSSNDHLIHLVQQVADQLDLVMDLGTAGDDAMQSHHMDTDTTF